MADNVKGPVCGTEIRPEDTAAGEERDGDRFYFRSAASHRTYQGDSAKRNRRQSPAHTRLMIALLAVAALVLSACQAGASPSPAATPTAPASVGARTVEVRLTDALRLEPSAITVKAGEPIHFVVTNAGTTDHEFFIGDEAAQEEHGMDMAAGEMMHDEPNGMSVPAGQTKTIDHTFGEAGQMLIGCHVAGHYEAGMKMDVAVEP